MSRPAANHLILFEQVGHWEIDHGEQLRRLAMILQDNVTPRIGWLLAHQGDAALMRVRVEQVAALAAAEGLARVQRATMLFDSPRYEENLIQTVLTQEAGRAASLPEPAPRDLDPGWPEWLHDLYGLVALLERCRVYLLLFRARHPEHGRLGQLMRIIRRQGDSQAFLSHHARMLGHVREQFDLALEALARPGQSDPVEDYLAWIQEHCQAGGTALIQGLRDQPYAGGWSRRYPAAAVALADLGKQTIPGPQLAAALAELRADLTAPHPRLARAPALPVVLQSAQAHGFENSPAMVLQGIARITPLPQRPVRLIGPGDRRRQLLYILRAQLEMHSPACQVLFSAHCRRNHDEMRDDLQVHLPDPGTLPADVRARMRRVLVAWRQLVRHPGTANHRHGTSPWGCIEIPAPLRVPPTTAIDQAIQHLSGWNQAPPDWTALAAGIELALRGALLAVYLDELSRRLYFIGRARWRWRGQGIPFSERILGPTWYDGGTWPPPPEVLQRLEKVGGTTLDLG